MSDSSEPELEVSIEGHPELLVKSSKFDRWKALLVLGLLLAIGLGSLLLSNILLGISALLIAVILGMIAGNSGRWITPIRGPANLASKKLLRVGIILLGFKLSLVDLANFGLAGIAVIAICVATTFLLTLMIGRILGVPKITRLLVATGFSICGASAVVAMSSVADPEAKHEKDAVQAIALVTIYGTIAMFVLPAMVPLLPLSGHQAGVWIGASIHEVAQVVAAGGMISTTALAIATVTKLGRVVLLAPLVGVFSVISSRRSKSSSAQKRPPLVPLFVLGFIGAVLIRTFVPIPQPVLDVLIYGANWLLAAAMFGLGFGVSIREMLATGLKPLLLGAASTLVAVTVAYVSVQLLLAGS